MNAVMQFVAIVALAPLLQGTLRSIRARLQGRPGPPPSQPYRELRKLWSKDALVASAASPIVIAAPGMVLGVALTFAALVPPIGDPTAPPAVAIALLLGLGRFALVLAAIDVRSSFAAMAASREMTFGALTEAPLIIALVALSAAIAPAAGSNPAATTGIAQILAAGALLLVMLSETARLPVDNQETHYELTMIHEGLLLEYSGWPLALLQAGAQVRQAAFFVLAARMLPGGPGWTLGWIAALIVAIPMVERTYAKLRLFEVPQLFVSAIVLALAGVSLRVAGAGAW